MAAGANNSHLQLRDVGVWDGFLMLISWRNNAGAAEWGAAEQWLHLALRAAQEPQRPPHLLAQCPLPLQQVRAAALLILPSATAGDTFGALRGFFGERDGMVTRHPAGRLRHPAATDQARKEN